MVKSLRYIAKYFYFSKKSNKIPVIVALFLSLIVIFCNILTPLMMKYIIESFSSQQNIQFYMGMMLAIGYGAIWTMGQLLNRFRSLLTYKASLRCIGLMIEDLFKFILEMPTKNQKNASDTLSLIERLNNHVPDLIEGIVWHIIPVLIEVVITFAIVISYTDIYISSLLMVTIFIYMLTLVLSVEKISNYHKKSGESHTKFINTLLDSINNLEIVKLFNGYDIESQKLNHKLNKKEKSLLYTNKQIEKVGSLQLMIVGCGLTLLTAILVSRIMQSKINVSDLILVNTYLLQFTIPLSYFGFMIINIQKGEGVVKEVLNILDNPSILDSEEASLLHLEETIEIHFENVNVEQEKETILQDLNMKIPSNEVTGILGLSGNGKTSLIKSMVKLFPITSGNLYFNKLNINEVSTISLRSAISIAPQDIQIFHDTILANITYGYTSFDHSKVDRVLEVTNLVEVMNRLPEGLNTVISNEMAQLSKGELQRITIARCIFKDAKVYVFDEPTSALDVKNEREIMEKMLEYLKGRTVVIITHRFATIKKADNFIIMGKGRVKSVEKNFTNEEHLFDRLVGQGVFTEKI